MHNNGAELAFAYQNERLLRNLKPIAESLDSNMLIECDVSSDQSIEQMFTKLRESWDSFDGFVHSIGFAPSDQLEGDFTEVTTREGFKIAHDISSYFNCSCKSCIALFKQRLSNSHTYLPGIDSNFTQLQCYGPC